MNEPDEPATLDFQTAYDTKKCIALMLEIMRQFGCLDADLTSHRTREPACTIRQIARMVAVEIGFNPTCVAEASNCTVAGVQKAAGAIYGRIQKQAEGQERRRAPDRHMIAPVLGFQTSV